MIRSEGLYSFYALALFAGAAGGLGDALLYQWLKAESKLWWLAAAFICWNIGLTAFLFALKRQSLSHCVIVFLLANCVIVLAASHFVFHEGITPRRWIGILLAIVAMTLMELG